MTLAPKIEVTFDITNAGQYDGEEVVQLYLRDKVASGVRPVKELKDFAKIKLLPGETKPVKFVLTAEKLSLYSEKLEWEAEPGDFELMIGASSEDIRLRKDFVLAKSN